MPSKLMIIGLVFLVLGIIPFILFTFIGLAIPPFVVKGGSVTDSIYISPGSSRQLDMGGRIGSHPLPVNVKAVFTMVYDNDYSCEATFVFSSTNPEIGERDIRTRYFSDSGAGGGETDRNSIQVLIIPPGTTSNFDVYIRIENTGSSGFSVENRYLQVTFTLYSAILPGILAIVGIIITGIGFITSRRGGPKVAKPKPIPGGWEPTLQWGGSSAAKAKTAKRQPKMAIKSDTIPQKTATKVVRKKVPTSGAQTSCKFCGKPVSPTAFFCPHCYGKLR